MNHHWKFLLLLTISLIVLNACAGTPPSPTPTLVAPVVEITTPTHVPEPTPTQTATAEAEPLALFYLLYNFPESDGLYLLPYPGQPKRIVEHDDITRPTFSPDGKQVAYLLNRSSELWVANRDGSEARQVANANIRIEDDPRCFDYIGLYHWLPESQTILFSTVCGIPGDAQPKYDLWRATVGTGDVTMLAEVGRHDFFPSPDGTRVAVARPEGIDLIDSNGTMVAQDVVTYTERDAPLGVFKPDIYWSADSAFISTMLQTDLRFADDDVTVLYRISREGVVEASRELADVVMFRQDLTFSPDGTLASIKDTNGARLVSNIFDAETLESDVAVAQQYLYDLGWSPDSKLFVYTSTDDVNGVLSADGVVTPFGPGVEMLSSTTICWVGADTFIFAGKRGELGGIYLQTVGEPMETLAEQVDASAYHTAFDVYVDKP